MLELPDWYKKLFVEMSILLLLLTLKMPSALASGDSYRSMATWIFVQRRRLK